MFGNEHLKIDGLFDNEPVTILAQLLHGIWQENKNEHNMDREIPKEVRQRERRKQWMKIGRRRNGRDGAFDAIEFGAERFVVLDGR